MTDIPTKFQIMRNNRQRREQIRLFSQIRHGPWYYVPDSDEQAKNMHMRQLMDAASVATAEVIARKGGKS